jgi:hypothetical protein
MRLEAADQFVEFVHDGLEFGLGGRAPLPKFRHACIVSEHGLLGDGVEFMKSALGFCVSGGGFANPEGDFGGQPNYFSTRTDYFSAGTRDFQNIAGGGDISAGGVGVGTSVARLFSKPHPIESLTMLGFTSGTKQWVRVRAVGADNGKAPWSDPAGKTVP